MKGLSAFAFLLIEAAAFAVELKPLPVIGTPVVDRQAAWNGHVDFIEWLDGQTLVYAGMSGFVKCHAIGKQAENWSSDLGVGLKSDPTGNIRHLSSGRGHVFVLDNVGSVHVLAGSTGKEVKRLDRDAIAKITRSQFILPVNLVWVPKRNAVLIAAFGGEGAYLLDDQSFKLLERINSYGVLRDLNATQSGTHIVSIANQARIWSLDDKKELLRLGEDKEAAIDAPFMSHALFDGDSTLVYSIDNSWNTGSVYVFDTKQKKEVVRFDSRNGHLEMDVDFKKSRIALTGTGQNLTIVDFKGKVLFEHKNAAVQRVVSVKFSPDQKHIAIGSWDNTLRVFEIKDDKSGVEGDHLN